MTKTSRVAASRQRRIIYEVSKRLVSGAVKNSLEHFPDKVLQIRSAIIIQRWFECRWIIRLARQELLDARRDALLRERSLASAKQIQLQFRRYQKSKQIEIAIKKRQEMASIAINSCARRRLAVLHVEKLRQALIYKRHCSSSVVIQSTMRTFLAKKRVRHRSEKARLVARAVSVLRRFFEGIAERKRMRRQLEMRSASIIRSRMVTFEHRTKFDRMKLASICVQKYIRRYRARKSFLAKKQLLEARASVFTMSEQLEVMPPTLFPFDETPYHVEKIEMNDIGRESLHGEDQSQKQLQQSTEETKQFEHDNQCNYYAKKIQRWYKKTRSVSIYLSEKIEQEEKLWREIKIKCDAATKIQAVIRIFLAKLKVLSIYDGLIELALREVEKEFGDSWKYSQIPRVERTGRKITKSPSISRKWLDAMPSSAHPPFKYEVT